MQQRGLPVALAATYVGLLGNALHKSINKMRREVRSHKNTFVFVVCNPNHVAGTETGLEIKLFKDLSATFRLSERAELPLEYRCSELGVCNRIQVKVTQLSFQLHAMDRVDVKDVLHWAAKAELNHAR